MPFLVSIRTLQNMSESCLLEIDVDGHRYKTFFIACPSLRIEYTKSGSSKSFCYRNIYSESSHHDFLAFPAGSVRSEEFFVFPRPQGGGIQMIISVIWTIPFPRSPLTDSGGEWYNNGENHSMFWTEKTQKSTGIEVTAQYEICCRQWPRWPEKK